MSPTKFLTISLVLCTAVGAVAQNSGDHTLTICANGQLNGFGRNAAYQLGLGYGNTSDEHSPVDIPTMTKVVCAAAGESHSLAVKSDGSVWAWGSNSAGSAGQPYPSVNDVYSPTQVTVPGCAVAVSAGASFSLVLLADSTVWAWGLDANGQLGNDGAISTTYGTPVQVAGITTAVAISAGSQHGMALLADGTVKTWGAGTSGELGNGAWTDQFTPVSVTAVSGFSDIVKIDAGGSHCIALNGSNQVFAWGSDLNGQLGNGIGISNQNTPQLISSFSTSGTVTDVAAGANFSIAIRSNGTTRGCGNNSKKQTTKCSPTTDQHTPVAGFTFPSTGEINVASTAQHGVYVNGSGQLYTWGRNFFGSIGNGTTSISICNPQLINGSGSEICSMIPSADNHPQPCCVAVREDERTQLGESGNQTYSGGFNYIGQYLSINNTITLQSGTFYFTDCDVVCWKDAKIVVKNGARLHIRTNSHLYACGDMWDGIYVEDGGWAYVYSGSIIEDAEVAVDVDKNGKYYLVDATLNKNYIHLRHTGPTASTYTPVRIQRSKFLCQESIIPFNTAHVNLLPPRQTEYTNTQVIATNVNKLYIGSSGNGNKFDHAVFGVMVNGVTDVEVLYNDFDDVSAGTYVTNAPNVSGAQIDINYNTYDRSIFPIFCFDNDTAVRAHITYNHIDFAGMVSPPSQMVGITYEEITPATAHNTSNFVDISFDTILNAPCGIELVNLQGDLFTTDAALYVGNNYVTHKNAYSGSAGIKTEQVTQGAFVGNEVSHPDLTVVPWEAAMRMEGGSANAFICNYTHDIGTGLFFGLWQTPKTDVINNRMENNDVGLRLNWAVIGPQGSSGNPRDNQWLGTSWSGTTPNTHVEGTDGALSPFYVRSSTPYNPQYNNNAVLGSAPISVNTTSGSWGGGCVYTDGASFKTDGGESNESEELLSLLEMPEAETERERSLQYTGEYNLYKALLAREELAASEPQLSEFLTDRNNSNMGTIHRAITKFGAARRGTGESLEVFNALQQIESENRVEETLKEVLTLLHANATDLTAIPSDAEARLREIAQLCPIDYGFGVYTARATLVKLDTLPKHYISECEIVPSIEKLNEKQSLGNTEESPFIVYPNPNNGLCTITYILEQEQKGRLTVFDISGKVVLQTPLKPTETNVEIRLSEIPSGLYMVRLEVDGVIKLSERVSVLKL